MKRCQPPGFSILEQRFPSFLGQQNPYNTSIEALFGDQGGH